MACTPERTLTADRDPIPGGGAHLTALDLHGNALGDEAALAISRATARLPMLGSIDMSRNPLGADGFLSLLSAAVSHPRLVSVRLPAPPSATFSSRHADATAKLLASLGDAASSLRELRFDEARRHPAEDSPDDSCHVSLMTRPMAP